MPGSIPPTSQLDWLISTTAMIVLFWSRATRDLLKSFGWGIAALHRFMQRRSCHLLAARPIASLGPRLRRHARRPLLGPVAVGTARDWFGGAASACAWMMGFITISLGSAELDDHLQRLDKSDATESAKAARGSR